VTTHIPFNTAMQLINNAVINNMEDEDESKDERDLDTDMVMELPTTVVPGQERPLDAIHVDDDMDETKSIIWVQCRRCKWSCPVKSYMVRECQCAWGPAEGLEEDMQAFWGRNSRSGLSTMTHTRCTQCMETSRRER
jgi:hypothetical protein